MRNSKALAILLGDWGSTHLRAWVIGEDGEVRARRAFDLGVAGLAPGEAAARFESEVRPALGAFGLPVLLSGMVGSNLGWTSAGYVDCPTSLAALAGALTLAAPGVRIVPGLRCAGLAGPDIMRGEETQVLGWFGADPARTSGRHLLCLPGTHAKWVRILDGAIERFVTAMTGEIYALLKTHGILRTSALASDEDADDLAAFDAGVDAAGDGGALAARLFAVRGRAIAGDLASESSAAFLSGLLIGAEVAALHPLMTHSADGEVDLVGEASLCAWYRRALARRGIAARVTDGEAAALAGLTAIWRQAK